jgi:hypothetical protein
MENNVAGISQNHPLRALFQHLVRGNFRRGAQLDDAELADYVSRMLTEFTHVENMYRIRNARGQRLADVAEMLIESNPLLDAPSFDRERAVRKHVGDFTLFFTGLFPEAVASLPKLRPLSVDTFVDYVAAGKESYRVVSAFNLFEYREEAPLFGRLAFHFEQCVHGLNLVKRDLEQMQGTYYRKLQKDVGLDY